MTPEIIQSNAAKDNFTPGRQDEDISMVVVHTEQGTDGGTAAWFANPHAHASAHYGISFEGRIRQFVQDVDTAWHSGNAHVNRCSIGIELEGFMERARFPEPMLTALCDLISDLATKYPAIQLDRKHIIGHCEVPDPLHKGQLGGANNHQDPGPKFPWSTVEDRLGMTHVAPPGPAVASVTPAPSEESPLVPNLGPEADGDPMVCAVCHLNQAIGGYDVDGKDVLMCASCASGRGLMV